MPKRTSFLSFICLLFFAVGAVAAPISIWSPLHVEWNNIIQQLSDLEFTPKFGIRVKVHSIPRSGYEQIYLLSAASGNVPEIGITSLIGATDLGVRGVTVDLSQYGEEYLEIKQQIYPGSSRALSYNEHNFGLPMQLVLYPLLYRSDILQELGVDVPSTWDELYGILPKLHAKNKNFYPAFGFDETQNDFVYVDASLFIWQHGGRWYNDDLTASALGWPESISGFTEYTELFTKRQVPKAAEPYVAFRQGDLPLMLSSLWQYAAVSTVMPELEGKWSISAVPGTVQKDGSISRISYADGMAFTIFKDSASPDDAFVWLQWFLSAEVQSKLASKVAQEMPGAVFLPANINAIARLAIPEDHIRAFSTQAQEARSPAYALLPEAKAQKLINLAVYETVIGGISPEEALRKAADKLTLELDQKRKEYARFIEKL
ncbi:MAG: extracellular solute-binding protein [Bacillota bacterium]|jgi:ABC-type glycerol-3-phosphate transport system substrate-binding protein|nr:extracellular solute-binding protein [Bacillota bacterium]NLU54911.1 extracellular solute-binding protein [Bacillota bacterium]HOA92101.1 extracellular solute-binding protein [Bacillota bacterium]HPQ09923.1 extracellular solute-binding protein [Bacillota bacterium]HPZ74191.1 extracellular solute-binding protein [Bacillota bacterium]